MELISICTWCCHVSFGCESVWILFCIGIVKDGLRSIVYKNDITQADDMSKPGQDSPCELDEHSHAHGMQALTYLTRCKLQAAGALLSTGCDCEDGYVFTRWAREGIFPEAGSPSFPPFLLCSLLKQRSATLSVLDLFQRMISSSSRVLQCQAGRPLSLDSLSCQFLSEWDNFSHISLQNTVAASGLFGRGAWESPQAVGTSDSLASLQPPPHTHYLFPPAVLLQCMKLSSDVLCWFLPLFPVLGIIEMPMEPATETETDARCGLCRCDVEGC